jgi:hypothetical protein
MRRDYCMPVFRMRKPFVALAAIIVGTVLGVSFCAIALPTPVSDGLADGAAVLIHSDYVGPTPHQLSKTWHGYPIRGIC